MRVVLAVEPEGGATNWNCTVDNQTIPSFPINNAQITNFLACDSGKMLSETTDEHTLVVNFWFDQQSSSNVSMIWLDSIQYEPLPSDPLDGVSMRIHNSDPSVIYSSVGAWEASEAAGLPVVLGDAGTNVSFAFRTGVEADLGYLVNFTFAGMCRSSNCDTPLITPTLAQPQSYFAVYGVNYAQFNGSTANYYYGTEGYGFIILSEGPTPGNIPNYPLFSTILFALEDSQYNVGITTNDNVTLNPEPLSISYFVVTGFTKNAPTPSPSPEPTPAQSIRHRQGQG